jgi:hypothetical protein
VVGTCWKEWKEGRETGKTGTHAEVAIQGPSGEGAGREERVEGMKGRTGNRKDWHPRRGRNTGAEWGGCRSGGKSGRNERKDRKQERLAPTPRSQYRGRVGRVQGRLGEAQRRGVE